MKHILSLDGGGVRGLIQAEILRAVERKYARGVPEGLLFGRYDLIFGTSVGAIIAGAIGYGMSAGEIADLIYYRSADIFRRSLWWKIKTAGGLRGPKWPSAPLYDTLKSEWGDVPLGASLTKIALTAYDATTGNIRVYKSWRAEWRNYPLVDAVAHSALAPYYFEPLDGVLDGGIWAPNPARCAITEGRKLWPGYSFDLLSLGTGEQNPSWDKREMRKWGLFEWAKPVLGMVFDGVPDGVHYHMARESHPAPPPGGFRYVRINPPLRRPVSMDTTNTKDLDYLRHVGQIASEKIRFA